MENQEILNYFAQTWEKVEQLSLEKGLNSGFYPIILPEVEDLRFIDCTLPALKSRLDYFKAQIVNPPAPQFKGLVLEEIIKEDLENNLSIVNIIYLQKGEVYSTQCLRETSLEMTRLKRYFVISPPELTQTSKERLQKAYNELVPLLEKA